jgi:hypothetical protein
VGHGGSHCRNCLQRQLLPQQPVPRQLRVLPVWLHAASAFRQQSQARLRLLLTVRRQQVLRWLQR